MDGVGERRKAQAKREREGGERAGETANLHNSSSGGGGTSRAHVNRERRALASGRDACRQGGCRNFRGGLPANDIADFGLRDADRKARRPPSSDQSEIRNRAASVALERLFELRDLRLQLGAARLESPP